MNPSHVDDVVWNNTTVYVKRDDLIDAYFSGNKYRKLYYYLHKDLYEYSKIVSYGGIQSNAMLSMAALAYQKSLPFIYYTRYLPKKIPLDIDSNYSKSIALGMEVKIYPASSDEVLREYLLAQDDNQRLFIPQGAATSEAQFGIKLLAQEILAWKKEHKIENLCVATPSGTGTTALWLHQHLQHYNITILTTAVVGDANYLTEQMKRISPDGSLPRILKTEKKYPFAKPNTDLYNHYKNFLDLGVTFDLIYAPVMWQALEENKKIWEDSTLLYVHSGGVTGNKSQLLRYEKLLTKSREL